jgi:hypothetical protein
MNPRTTHQPSRLPKRFPIGTTYVIEGRAGQNGHLRVFSRYIVLPSGRRVSVAGDFGPSRVPARDCTVKIGHAAISSTRAGTH